MMLFIFQDVQDIGDGNYHAGGGVVVVARNRADILEVAPFLKAHYDLHAPDMVYALHENEHHDPAVFKFPNAGCC